jgi:hypothetical protein
MNRRQVYTHIKIKLSLCFMKAYWGNGRIASRILDVGTRRWVVSFTSWPLYSQGKRLWYPMDRRLGGPQSRSEHGDEEKNSQPLKRITEDGLKATLVCGVDHIALCQEMISCTNRISSLSTEQHTLTSDSTKRFSARNNTTIPTGHSKCWIQLIILPTDVNRKTN